jgi:hypothetical protein
MVIDRRQILALMLAGLAGSATARGEALRQRLLVACRMDAAQTASVACFDSQGREVFATALPARGHDAAVNVQRREVAVFARRPGNWFAVIDSGTGSLRHTIHAAEGRHFYGHGVFSQDGRLLYATENNMASGEGVIGIYGAADGYRRVGEFASGGIGPHDIVLMPDGRRLAVANGGLRTHPDTGRETLNPDDMSPNLALIDLAAGRLIAIVELDHMFRRLSIRHLALRDDGLLAFGCQHEGDSEDLPPLLGTLSSSGRLTLLDVPEDALARLDNYVGSVSLDDSGNWLTATSPRGGTALIWNLERGALAASLMLPDVCGVAASGNESFLLSSGNAGLKTAMADGSMTAAGGLGWIWDNHTLSLDSGR